MVIHLHERGTCVCGERGGELLSVAHWRTHVLTNAARPTDCCYQLAQRLCVRCVLIASAPVDEPCIPCTEFRPDHNGECLNCDEWLDAHTDAAIAAGEARARAARREA